jgi:hypothetical protein
VLPADATARLGMSSNLNLSSAGQTIANLVIVPVAPSGNVTFYTSGGTHLIADVAGYYTDASAQVSDAGLFQAVEPYRELDTRKEDSYYGTNGQRPAGGSETRIDTTSRVSLPSSGVAAVVMNVAAVGAAGAGFVQVLPTGRVALGSSPPTSTSPAGR